MLSAHWGVEPKPEALAGFLRDQPSEVHQWVYLAAVTAEIPSVRKLQKFQRRVIVDGGATAAMELYRLLARQMGEQRQRHIEIVNGAVLVDVHDTVSTARTSGIQRVVRETVRHWRSRDETLLVGWTRDGRALRRLNEDELVALDEPANRTPDDDAEVALIPAGGRFIAVELVAETWRARRLEGLGWHPKLMVGAIGYDCVPLTSPETASTGIARQFPLYLHALASASRVVAISQSAGMEFRGWGRMLRGSGRRGPEVSVVELAAEIQAAGTDGIARAAMALQVRRGDPLVLVVGSHEPRKNHLAVLQAARVLWGEGHRFHLGFIGATSWSGERFEREVAALQRQRRAVTVLTAADDQILAGAYQLAHVSVFPSLHEGFGLPVAESLSLGTPVVTSCYGSMREIVESGGGGLLVDPRDDDDLADAIRVALTNAPLMANLRAEAAARSVRTWASYADELWAAFSN